MGVWLTAPIRRQCEVLDDSRISGHCDQPTSHAYPAMNFGWMALCEQHAAKHVPYAKPVAELVAAGETMQPRS